MRELTHLILTGTVGVAGLPDIRWAIIIHINTPAYYLISPSKVHN